MMVKDDKRIINAWTFYDWANSSFPLVINSAIFPYFFEEQTTIRDKSTGKVINDMVDVFGFQMKNTELYSFVVSLALIVVCFTAPILSGVADYSGNKKKFLSVFCILGSVSCAGLYFFDPSRIVLSMLPFFLATIGFWGSLVFYNAYLPEIASTENMDRVSAKGFARGYFGSSILLILNLILIKVFNMNPVFSFITVAVWWLGFAQITLNILKDHKGERKEGKLSLTKGFKELSKVWSELKHDKRIKRFLSSYFLYNMGVQTVLYMAVLFAAKEINWPHLPSGGLDKTYKSTALIISILLIQFLGMGGSYLFSFVSSKIGNIPALRWAVFFWGLVCIGVFFFVYEPYQFYITAACVGLVMGGTQSLSRSTYSKLLPETEDHASYFSFFDVLEKMGMVIGTFAFGLIEGITGGMRNSILALITFFILGLISLLMIPKEKTIAR